MTDQPLIKAPEGWLDYASGAHFKTAQLAAAENEYLNLLARIDLRQANADADPIESGILWQTAEYAAILRSPDGRHWPARFAALSEVMTRSESLSTADPSDHAKWIQRVATGRLYINLAQSLQRSDRGNVFKGANDFLDQAIQSFAGIEGEDFFQAQAQVVRGRLLAWNNDIIGATASQSNALSVFRKYGNRIREAEAAYELAMANLDANLPDPALPLFELAISAHRDLNCDGDALARALQSSARAQLTKARRSDSADQARPLIEKAKRDAFEAFLMSDPIADAKAPVSTPNLPAKLINRDTYRAAMSAREIGDAFLLEAGSNVAHRTTALESSKSWLIAAATELGFGEIFSEGGRRSMRQEIKGDKYIRFDVLRVAQLEFEILAETSPEAAAPLLIETGKRYENQNYTVECFEAAARSFDAEAKRTSDASLASEANYWRHRAARLALSIGSQSEQDVTHLDILPDSLRSALNDVRDRHAFNMLRLDESDDEQLHSEIILSGRQTASRLSILSAEHSKAINLDLLKTIAERGDIPQILDAGTVAGGALFIIQEIPVGRRLSEVLPRDLPGDMRVRLGARLCRTMASLIRAHSANGASAQPLYVTLEDIMIEPGNRSMITSFGPIGRKHAPSLGWSFLYPTADPKTSTLKDGLDAQALAKMLIILLGVEKINHRHLSFPSYLRRALAWFAPQTPMEQLSFEATHALSKLAKGNLKVSRSYEKSLRKGEEISKREVKGVAELIYLASLFDSAANQS